LKQKSFTVLTINTLVKYSK